MVGGGKVTLSFLAEESAELREGCLELTADTAVDEEVWWEVEDDKEMSHWLQTHDPQGGDVVALLLDTVHLYVCKSEGWEKFDPANK